MIKLESKTLPNLTEDEVASANFLFRWGVESWMEGQIGERQTIRISGRKEPLYVIDRMGGAKTNLVVLFERDNGSIEDSTFRLADAYRNDQPREINLARREIAQAVAA